MLELWVILALLSGVFVSLREVYIKKYISHPPEVISFTTRFYGSLLILCIAYRSNLVINNRVLFIGITITTVIITAFATLIRLKLIKEEELSLTTPWLGSIPLFMVIWSAIIYQELPNKESFIGIVLVCIGAFTINLQGKTIHIKKASVLMILLALLLGFTTSIDRIAIQASSAITYSLFWTMLSALFMYGIAKRKTKKVLLWDKHLMVQAIFWVVEFLLQMFAVQYVSTRSSGITYVKTLTMLHIVITTVLGGLIFREKETKGRIVSSFIIFIGAAVLVIFR